MGSGAKERDRKMQAGKKNTYILSSNTALNNVRASIIDTFRRMYGKYWLVDRRGIKYGNNRVSEAMKAEYGTDVFFGKTITMSQVNPPFYTKLQEVYLRADENHHAWAGTGTQGRNAWQELMKKIIPDRNRFTKSGRFMDMSFIIDTPLSKRESEFFGSITGLGYFNVNFEYNFYVASFEQTIASVPEGLLPNIYSFISEQAGKSSRNMRNLLTFNGQLPRSQAVLANPSTRENEGTFDRRQVRSYYFYLKASNALSRIAGRRQQQLSKLYRNYIFPFENLSILSDTSLKSQFPMYAEIEFSTDRTTTVAQILEDASLSTSLLKHVAAAGENGELFSKRFLGSTTQRLVSSSEILTSQNSSSTAKNNQAQYETIDLITWWKNYLRGDIPQTVFKEQTLVGPKTLSTYVSSGADNNNLSQAIHCLIFSGKLQETIKNNLRSFEQIWNGETNPTETVLYCVEKYDTAARSLVQRYWFPNSNNIDVIKFVDTQIKYGKQYTYSVFAYQLAFGEEYSYGPLEMDPPKPWVTIYKPCPEFPYPELNGLRCFQGLDGSEVPACIRQDANKLIEVVYPGLGVDTSNVQELTIETVKAYMAVRKATALGSGIYVAVLSKYISQHYGHRLTHFLEFFSAAIRDYQSGEIEYETPPSPQIIAMGEVGGSFRARTVVKTFPCLKLVKVPYFSRTGYMLDDPPVFPDVNIVPYKSENNKLLIWLNMNVGDYEFYPVALNDEEQKLIDKIRQKNLLKPSDPIRYKTDDYVREFQIFRMLEKPESYKDFATKERAKLSTSSQMRIAGSGDFTNFKASSISYVDGVVPNTKYYYMFRAVDTHGHISYPSPVYEVELIDNDGAVYPIINTIPVEEAPKPYDVSKVAKRYIHIAPRITQGLFNMQASGLDDGSFGDRSSSATVASSYVLGVEDETLWGKKFKVRFISKSTGRKIDLNITYENAHVISPEQVEIQQQGVIELVPEEVQEVRNYGEVDTRAPRTKRGAMRNQGAETNLGSEPGGRY